MKEYCEHLADLSSAQREVILKHLANHKWLRQISDEQAAKIDFVQSFGLTMRELFCGFICTDRCDCCVALNFLPHDADLPLVSDQTLENCRHTFDLLTIRQSLLNKHLSRHSECQSITDQEQDKRDFLARFDWLISEMYCRYACPDRFVCANSPLFFPIARVISF